MTSPSTASHSESPCSHPQVQTLVRKKNEILEISAFCMQCKADLHWVGVPVGPPSVRPTVSEDGLTLRAPITTIKGLAQDLRPTEIHQHIGVEIERGKKD